jgi:transcriptional regulator with XRE-family HTH domain
MARGNRSRLTHVCPECEQRRPIASLGQAVKWDRLRRKVSVREYGRLIGISAATVSRIERGGEPDLVSAASICQFLDLPAAFVIDEVRKQHPQDQR